MPIKNYGVWTGTAVRVSAETAAQDPKSPHIHLFYDDGTGGKFDGARRASINVKSLSAISELVYWFIPDYRHPVTEALGSLTPGFRSLPSQPGGLALDYLRGNLMEFSTGRVLAHDLPGGPNDIIDYAMPDLQAAVARGATVHLFGEPYSDKQGIHDIHMNQGSVGQFTQYNGVWQDGAVFLHFAAENRTAAMFFAFASQAVHTDEATGNALPGSQNFATLLGRPTPVPADPTGPAPEPTPVPVPAPIRDDRRVAILAALINPEGPENQPDATGRPEMVYLVNRGTVGQSLAGWQILNRADTAHVLGGDVWLAPGEVRAVTLGQVTLSNKGGTITLLDAAGLKVDGVSYLAEDARPEGYLTLFRHA